MGIGACGIVCSHRPIDSHSLLSSPRFLFPSSERVFALARSCLLLSRHSLPRQWSRGVSSQLAIVVFSRGSPPEVSSLPTNPRRLPPLRSFTSIPANSLRPSSAVMMTESPSVIACEVHEEAFHPTHNDTFFGVAHFLTANSQAGSRNSSTGHWRYSRGESSMDVICDDDERTSFALETASWLQFNVPRES